MLEIVLQSLYGNVLASSSHKDTFPSLKPGSHITVIVPVVPAVVSQPKYDYGTCVLSQVPQAEFNLVCGTAGTVQSEEKKCHESLMKYSSS